MEDADLLLTSREDDGNKLISRFLNVSDGLIRVKNKKMIFTTNISDFSKIDHAIIRPGRCYDFMHCRPLTALEARAAAAVAGVSDPGKSVSLAELFNGKKAGHELPKMGFIR